METIFLETNSINSCFYSKYSGSEFKEILSTKNLQPVISQHTTYEVMRNFTSDKNKALGISLFEIIKELSPTFSCQTSTLLQRELNKLTDDVACDYMIEPFHLKKLEHAINQICKGNIAKEYIDYVENREADITNDQSLWKPLFSREKISTFEEFYLEVIQDNKKFSKWVNEVFKKKLDDTLSKKLSTDIDNFKVIRTAFRANLYMSFIARKHKTPPALDKTDDFRHLIDASLCSYLVTDDNNLRKYAKLINPELKVITFDHLIENL